MDAPSEADPIRLAERVATAALGLGIETAVIGALALAAHKYVRATEDVDLAWAVNVYPLLRELEEGAIRNAVALDPGSALRYVQLPDLIALKLYAGGMQDFGDIVAVLKHNPDADLEEIRARAARFDRRGKLEELIAEARGR